MKKVYDSLRKEWVKAAPEEIVRQLLLKKMFLELGYPKEYVALEKELKMLPHLAFLQSVPDRRIDIVCFQKENLKPLLLVECKSESLSDKTIEQAIGYNLFVKAPFIAIVTFKEAKFWQSTTGELFSYFPSYNELILRL